MSPKLFSPDARFFYLKCKKINFGWGLTVLPRHILAGFGEGKGKGVRGGKREEGWEGKESKEEGRGKERGGRGGKDDSWCQEGSTSNLAYE